MDSKANIKSQVPKSPNNLSGRSDGDTVFYESGARKTTRKFDAKGKYSNLE
jgi:hypothetical protein